MSLDLDANGGIWAAERRHSQVSGSAGKHTIEVKAPTRQTWTREVVVVGDGASMEETVPMLKMAPVEVLPGNGSVVQSVAATATWMKPVGGVALGVGILGVGLGGIFAGLAKSRNDASNAKSEGDCDAQNWCNARGVELRQEAKRFGLGDTANRGDKPDQMGNNLPTVKLFSDVW